MRRRRLFEQLNITDPYVHVHTKDLGRLSTKKAEGSRINETLALFGLRPDILFVHGQERVDYFYNDELREKVRESWWKEDVEMFGEY